MIKKRYDSSEKITRQDRTEKFFTENKRDIFEVDIEKKCRYKALKYYLTELHRLFIIEALKALKSKNEIDFSSLFEYYEQFENCKDDKQKKNFVKVIASEKLKIAKYFGDKAGKGGIFQEIAKAYHDDLSKFLKDNFGSDKKIKGSDDEKKGFANGAKNILLSQNVLMILDKKIKEGSIQEKVEYDKSGNNKYALKFTDVKSEPNNLIGYFSGWSTYFKNFNEIRGNLYKDEGRKENDENTNENLRNEVKIRKANAGQLTTRILDENFEIFVRNFIWAKKNLKNLNLIDFQSRDIVEGISILEPNYYIKCLLQTDINKYNNTISDLNKFFNEHKKKGSELKYLKPLFKQLLLMDEDKGEEDTYIEELVDDGDLINGLNKFYKHANEKISIIKNFLVDGKIDDNLDDVLLDENQLHFFCNQFFGSWSYLRDLYKDQNDIKTNRQSEKDNELKDKEGVLKTEFSLSEIKVFLNKETKDDFKQVIEKGNFDFLGENDGSKIYQEDLSNFDNFILFLKFYIDSLVKGKRLLTKREKEDKRRLGEVKEELEKSKSEGEVVDELLLAKFSEDKFTKDISESVDEKKQSFKNALLELRESVNNKKSLPRERDFECKKAINEYCNRISDINRFFTLFVVPEGVTGGCVNNAIRQFKHNNEIVPLFNMIRNFITKRSVEIEKIKLNFNNQSLLDGWDLNKETERLSFIFIDEKDKNNKKYYLVILKTDANKKLFEKKDHPEFFVEGRSFKKMEYKFFKDASRMIPKCSTQLNVVKNYFSRKENTEFIAEKGKTLKKDSKIIKPLRITRHIFELNNFEYEKEYLKTLKKTGYKLDISKKMVADKDKNTQIKLLQKDYLKLTGDIQTYKDSLREWINFCKDFLNSYESTQLFGFDFKKTEEYESLDEFYKDIAVNTYSVKLNSVDSNYLQTHKDAQEIFLFQIYSKDFSKHKKDNSTKNLHTLYFEELFSKENNGTDAYKGLPIFKLSGGAEIFFREKIDDHKIVQWERKDLKQPETDKTPYKKRRFTENQILFYVPIVLNHINNGGNVNKEIHQYIQENYHIKVLGIDRGEKELAYYCLLDKDGKICGDIVSMNETGTNIIKDKDGVEKKQGINYQKKLDIKEKERMIARRSWTKIEGIKDLKQGYISNVVNTIAKLMVNKNAINAMVCLEDLNHGFKQDRSIRIEKGVYQHLENALVDKLNYLVLEKSPNGIRNALQLTPLNRAQKYWGKQMGAIFYTDAKFTSKTCPNCGFRKRGMSGLEKPKNIKEKINSGDLKIFFEKEYDRFRIEYNWHYELKDNNTTIEFTNENLYGDNKMEIIYSDVERSFWNKRRYKNEKINPNNDLKKLFADILNDNNVNLFELLKKENNFFYSEFNRIFNSISNIRNTVQIGNESKDIISCPKCHSSTLSPKVKKIKNGDANGAYNIARRGLMSFKKIRSDKLKKKSLTQKGIESKDLKITLKEWDEETYKQWDKKDWEISNNERGL